MMFGLFGKKKEERSTLSRPSSWLVNTLTGGSTASGIVVNENTALNYSVVYAAVRLLSESVASLPLHTYKQMGADKERDREHPVARLLASSPNTQMTSYTFRETIQAHALTWGNGYAEIVRDGSGTATALIPVTPDRVRPDINKEGKVIYVVDDQVTLEQDQMLHLAGLGFDGIQGYSIIQLSRECLALGMAAEKFGSAFFGNGTRLGGVLEHPGKLSKEGAERLRESWAQAYSGTGSVGKTALLEEGMKWTSLGIPPDDAQFLETRKFQIDEVARWFGVPPHMIGSMEHATFSNIEHQQIEFVTHTLRPWLVRWEQEIARKLFDGDHFPEFQVDGLLRGDTRTRYESYRIARESGWMSVNEIRSLENLNPVDGGDKYILPLNMGTVDEPADEPTDDDRSWQQPLLEDALYRAKRIQENKERQARDRKGEHFEGWRSDWRSTELPALMSEILSPVVQAIAGSYDMDNSDTAIMVEEMTRAWICDSGNVSLFAKMQLRGIR